MAGLSLLHFICVAVQALVVSGFYFEYPIFVQSVRSCPSLQGLESIAASGQVEANEPDLSTPNNARQVKCDGPLPDLDISSLLPGQRQPVRAKDYFDTARSMCAKLQYGGSVKFNAGLYCESSYLSSWVWFQSFHCIAPENPLAAITIFCQMRCQCVRTWDLDGFPASKVIAADREPLNINNYIRFNPSGSRWRIDEKGVTYFEAAFRQETRAHESFARSTKKIILPSAYERPLCEGPVPRWVIPKLFLDVTLPYAGNAQMFCAAGFFGGSVEGNAGAVCHKEGRSLALQFLDYLAHPALLNEIVPSGLAAVLWCKSACTCGGIKAEITNGIKKVTGFMGSQRITGLINDRTVAVQINRPDDAVLKACSRFLEEIEEEAHAQVVVDYAGPKRTVVEILVEARVFVWPNQVKIVE